MKRLILPLIAVLVSGCSIKNYQRQANDGGSTKTVTDQNLTPQGQAALLEKIDVSQFDSPASALSVESLLAGYAQVHKLLFTEPMIIDDPMLSHSIKVRDLVKMLGKYALQISNSTGLSNVTKAVYAMDYSKQVFENCASQFAICPRVALFANDPLSSEIIMSQGERIGAELDGYLATHFKSIDRSKLGGACALDVICSTILRKYYSYYLMAYNLRNAVPNKRIALGYVRFASLYGDYFMALPDVAKAEWEYQQHQLIFEISFSSLDLKAGDKDIISLLNHSENFLFSRAQGSSFDNKIFLAAAQLYLYQCNAPNFTGDISKCPTGSVGLSSEFKIALDYVINKTNALTKEDLAAKPNPQAPASISLPFEVKSINQLSVFDMIQSLQSDQGEVLANLGLDTGFPQDEYFYLVNGVFHGDLSVDDAAAFWQYTHKDFTKLQTTMEKYLKLYSVYMVAQTNHAMNQLYSERAKYTSDRLLQHVLGQSDQITRQWVVLRDNVDKLRGFTDVSLTGFAGFKDLDVRLREYRKSIKFTSVYPTMMMMMYYLSDVNFSFTVETFFGEMTINAADLVQLVFSGTQKPWVYFGNDDVALNSFELLYAFYFTMKTETITNFGNIPSLDGNDGKPKNVDEYQYFNLVLPKIYNELFTTTVQSLRRIRTMTSDQNYANFQKLCSELRDPTNRNAAGEAVGMVGITTPQWREKVATFSSSSNTAIFEKMDFIDLRKHTFVDSLRDPENMANTALLAYDWHTFEQIFDAMNSDFIPTLERAKSMLAIVKFHFDDKIAREKNATKKQAMIQDYKQKVASIEQLIARAENNITALVSYWVNTNDDISNCLDMVGYVGRKRAQAVYSAEREYLRKIHLWMAILQVVDTRDGKALATKPLTEATQVLLALKASPPKDDKNNYAAMIDSLKSLGDWNTIAAPLLDVMNADLAKVAANPKVPLMNRSGERKYSGFDKITWTAGQPPIYTYSLTDMLFRFLGYYRDGIAPNIYDQIVMPADLQVMQDYSEQKGMPYDEDFGKFMRVISNQLGGNATSDPWVGFWNNQINFDLLVDRKSILSQLYVMGDLTVYPNECASSMISYSAQFDTGIDSTTTPTTISADCKAKKVVRRVTTDDLINAQLESVKVVDAQPEEQTFMVEMNHQGFYDLSKVQNFILDKSDVNKPAALFQAEAERLVNQAGHTLDMANSYFVSQRNVGTLLFDVEDRVQKSIKCQFLTRVESVLTGLNKYRDDVVTREHADGAVYRKTPEAFMVHYGYDGSNILSTSFTPNGEFSYVLPTTIQDISAKIKDFNENTVGFFDRTTPADASGKFNILTYYPTAEECSKLIQVDWQ